MWDVTVENNEFREKGGCCYLEVEVTVRSAVLCEILKYQNYAKGQDSKSLIVA